MAYHETTIEVGLIPDGALSQVDVRYSIDWLGDVEEIDIGHATRKGQKWVSLDRSNPIHLWLYNAAIRQLSEADIDEARREAMAEREDDGGDYRYHQSVGSSLISEAW